MKIAASVIAVTTPRSAAGPFLKKRKNFSSGGIFFFHSRSSIRRELDADVLLFRNGRDGWFDLNIDGGIWGHCEERVG